MQELPACRYLAQNTLIVGCQFFQPLVDVGNQSALSVVDVDACGDVHRAHKHKAFLNAALPHKLLYLVSDVDVFPPFGSVEPQIFGYRFFYPILLRGTSVTS
jgi:hypothetical protein